MDVHLGTRDRDGGLVSIPHAIRTKHVLTLGKTGVGKTTLIPETFGDVRIDKCFNCEGVWLGKGELESIQTKEPAFMGRLLSVFRS